MNPAPGVERVRGENRATMRPVLGVAFLAYLAFVIYGSLVPLEFRHLPLEDAIREFREIRYLDLGIRSRADWVANLLLFVPLAFLGTGLLWSPRRRFRNTMASIAVLLGCMALTTAIEFVQIYFPQRTVSINDMLAESLGALLGVTFWWIVGPGATGWLSSRLARTGEFGLSQIALYAYLFLKFGYDLLPLDLTLSPVELFHKWQEGRVHLVPFGFAFSSPESALYGLAADVATWIPAGVLARLGTRSSDRTIWVRLVAAAIVLEFLQLWVYSRVTDVTDVLTAGIGAFVGILVGRQFMKRPTRAVPTDGRSSRLVRGGLVVGWMAVLVTVFWYPFEVISDTASIRDNLQSFFRVPFTTYYFTSEYQAITQVFRRMAFFAPLGVLLGYPLFRMRGEQRRRLWIAVAAGIAVAFSLGIELGQVAFEGKTPDATDWILEAIAATGGLAAMAWLARRRSRSEHPAQDTRAESSSARIEAARPAGAGTVRPVSSRPSRLPRVLMTLGMAGVAVAFLLITRLPFVPYNVRELLNTDYRLLSAMLFSAFLYWTFATPVWFARKAMRHRRTRHRLPLFVLLHGGIAYLLLRGAVPVESIHDVVGSPTLGGLPEPERLGRFVALFAVLSLALVLGAIATRALGRRRWTGALTVAVAWWAALGGLAYWIVVGLTGTDNLTELIAGGGTFFGAACLALYWVVVCATASLLASAPWKGYRQLLPTAAIGVAVSLPLSYGLAVLGTESQVFKYGQTFSALQFLLSAGRDQLASGGELLARYVVLHAVIVAGIAFVQAPIWGNTAWLDSQGRNRSRTSRPRTRRRQERDGESRQREVQASENATDEQGSGKSSRSR